MNIVQLSCQLRTLSVQPLSQWLSSTGENNRQTKKNRSENLIGFFKVLDEHRICAVHHRSDLLCRTGSKRVAKRYFAGVGTITKVSPVLPF